MPSDLILYQQEIWNNKPDFIIDSGTRFGGSALFYADILEMIGKGKVISIDIVDRNYPPHPRIQYLTGGSTSVEILQKVKEIVGNGSVMVVLDSDHSRIHVKRELHHYASIVTKGQFMVVEDCYDRNGKPTGPNEAREWFMKTHKGFAQEYPDKKYIVSFTRDGWLKKL